MKNVLLALVFALGLGVLNACTVLDAWGSDPRVRATVAGEGAVRFTLAQPSPDLMLTHDLRLNSSQDIERWEPVGACVRTDTVIGGPKRALRCSQLPVTVWSKNGVYDWGLIPKR